MNVIDTKLEPVFTRDGTFWLPHVEATGPFRGLHGGAVSGLVVAAMEERAREKDWGQAMTASVLILRPAPLERLETRIEVLRSGGRVAMLESSLWAGERLIAKATGAFVKPISLPEVSRVSAAPAPVDPSALPVWGARGPQNRTTFFDALDIRDDGNGTKWGRMKRPMVAFEAPMANLFAFADNGTPYWLSGTEFWPPTRWGFPNIDIAVHISRAPVGPWVGVEPGSDWRDNGLGLTDSKLYDEAGPLGRACQTVVLTPH
ncbi:MAG: thioesterase family protein [Parvibaculum sedimenti]|uniref:thioesterase family protein n=1 Tax=Parvibaculum sedimenti TaxID=2608632 RepID=UPI003BB5592C